MPTSFLFLPNPNQGTSPLPQDGIDEVELSSLPVTVDLLTAARALGIGRTTAYTLAKRGEMPVKVLRLGKSYRVITSDLRRLLESPDGKPTD
ncbi:MULTISPECIES: helix-turn-helix domain-containing protein [unclassified Crossiella]|uniref:helix-turn-helix domain-containing protein n=1 Tax=unclassified Crossiella TaxID=2620835 RepID=UPI0024949702|nr:MULTISPECIES: helix-turn-helix domain-containing protein [unclassified Crossiella]